MVRFAKVESGHLASIVMLLAKAAHILPDRSVDGAVRCCGRNGAEPGTGPVRLREPWTIGDMTCATGEGYGSERGPCRIGTGPEFIFSGSRRILRLAPLPVLISH